jgi:hypothetical protein
VLDPSELDWSNKKDDPKLVPDFDNEVEYLDVLAPAHFGNVGLDMHAAETGMATVDDIVDEALAIDMKQDYVIKSRVNDSAARFTTEGMQWATPMDLDDDIIVIEAAPEGMDPDKIAADVTAAKKTQGPDQVDVDEAIDLDADFGDLVLDWDENPDAGSSSAGATDPNIDPKTGLRKRDAQSKRDLKAFLEDKNADLNIHRKSTLVDLNRVLEEADVGGGSFGPGTTNDDDMGVDLGDVSFGVDSQPVESMSFSKSFDPARHLSPTSVNQPLGASGSFARGAGLLSPGSGDKWATPSQSGLSLRSQTLANLQYREDEVLGPEQEFTGTGGTSGTTTGSSKPSGPSVGKDQLLDVQTFSSEEEDETGSDDSQGVIITRHLSPHRSHAYIVCAIYCILCIAIVYTITAGWSRPQLTSFWYTMICAALADLIFAEWFYLAMKVLYCWMISDTAALVAEIHPYEGEEVLRDW